MSSSPSKRNGSADVATKITEDVNTDDAQQFQQIIRDRKDEREDIQKKAFTKWINNQLANTSSTPAITDLFQDLRDGVVLLRLLEVLTGNEYKRENGKMRVHHIGNVNKVIAVLNEHGIKLLNISSNDIVDGNPKLTLALIWSIIQYWQGKDVIKSAVPDSQQTNIEKFLLSWCQQQTKGYKSVEINDFTRSWQDGLAFNALIHKFRPDLFDYEEILQNAAARNLEHAFSVAKNIFKIDRYLDVEDVISEFPDKKSILMYVMCLFQQLPSSNIVIEDKEKTTTDDDDNNTMETKSPSEIDSSQLIIYQTNMEKILEWILQLEEELDKQDDIVSDDLKIIKEKFQNHEEFMISLTQDQNQIGDVLQRGNQLLTSKEIDLSTQEENEIKEQMKILNRRWESLRSKSLDRQTILHKTLMKLQIQQIESFDTWLSQTEQHITKDLSLLKENLSGIDQQYQNLAQLQDELVSQQQITESLQNMIIVIDDSSSNDENSLFKYTSTEIENKLLNLSERWANICNFVQNRWIQLQEIKLAFEQIELNRDKVDNWLTYKEDEMNKMKSETNLNNTDILMQQVHSIQKTETEMDDMRQSILSLDNSLKILSTHYDGTTSNELKTLNDQINNFEKRWTKLIDDLEQCSTRLKNSNLNFETSAKTNVKPDSDVIQKIITTTVEETTTTTSQNVDDSINKKQKIDNVNTIKSDFDLSARKYIDWIDNIERILDEKPSSQSESHKRQDIIQEIKTKYISYDDQFKTLIQTGNIITKQLKDENEDSNEHESFLKTLENRWQKLYQQILKCEKDIEQSIINDEIQSLTQVHNEYQTWLDSTSSSTSITELQVKFKSFQSYNERLANLRRMTDRLDTNTAQRTDDLLRSWDETHSRLRERSIPVEYMQQQSSGTTSSGGTSFRQTGTSSVPASPNRIGTNEQSTTTTTTTAAATATTNLNPSIGENGSLFTLTNIYTFGGGDGTSTHGPSDLSSDKYRVKSFVEVFDQPSSQQDTEYERHYRETQSSSSFTRKVRTSATDTYDYGDNGHHDSSRYQHHYETTGPSSTKYIHEQKSSGTGDLSLLPTVFTDTQRTLRLWLEHVEQSLLNDKIRIVDIHSINVKKKVYKDLLDQTFEQEHNLETLNEISREYYSKLSIDVSRRLQQEITNYQDRLQDIKMFLSDRLAKYTRIHKTLTDFESGVEEVKLWIRNAQPRLATIDTSSRGLENQLGRNQVLQHEIREMQIIVNRLNKDVVDLTQDADENLARRLRDEMQRLNESWSHIISSAKVYSQNIQDTLKRNKVLQEEIRELEDWISDKEREILIDDGAIFYQEQLRERLEQYQKLQTELNLKEYTVRTLVDQVRQDLNQSSSSPELSQTLETFISNWSSLQKKIDHKLSFYSDLYKLHEELKDLLYHENIWLDALQNKIYGTVNTGADAEETSEELDSLERFVKTHPKSNYAKILEISDRLQTTKISIPTTSSQINQFQIRWDQLHADAVKKIHSLNSQISDYQQLGHQITAMFEWIRHTDNTLNARLKDDVYADDVPAETDKLIVEFNQYDAFLRSIEDKIHTLRSIGKHEAAKRLEQQFLLLKNQFLQLQNKFRQFQKPSDFGPKYARMRQMLHDVEQHMYTLEIRSDDPDVIHSQLEYCLKLYKTLSDIKSEVEYVIRIGRGIVEKGQTDESNDLARQIDQLKATYNNLGAKVSSTKNQLDSVERHVRKFRKEYSHIHEWFVKADYEIRKIENKQVSKNTKEEIDWIRTTRNDIKKLEANFETLRTLERNIQKEAERQLPSLHEKITELRRQIDHLDRRLKDRSEIVEGQVRKLDVEYETFSRIYQEIIIRLDKLETLLSDAERVLDLTRISQVQDELRSVRTQLDEILNLGQELVSKSEKYSKLVGPDIETITRKFEELQHRIRIIQETQDKRIREQQTTTTTTTTANNNNVQDDQQDNVRREYYSEKRYNRTERETRHRSPSESSDISISHGAIDEEFKKKYLRCLAYMKLIERLYENQQETDEDTDIKHRRSSRRERTIRDRPEYEEIERIIRETEERAYFIEKTDVEQARRIREKIRRLKECLENLKIRSDQYEAGDEVVRYNERYEEHIRTTDRTVPKEREFDSDFIYDIDDTRSVISEPAPYNKYRKTVHSLERYRADDQARYIPTYEEYQLQPLLRVRSLKAIDHRTLSAPSSPILQPRYRSYERSNVQYTKQSSNQQGSQNNFQSSISKSASMPNGGFPLQQNLLPHPPPPPPNFYPQQPMMYRERVIDKHIAEKSTSRGESHRQQHQESSGHIQQQQQQQQSSGHTQQQQQQQQTRSASASGQTQTLNRSIPVRYETSNTNANIASSTGFRTTNGYTQEQHPTYFYNEQQGSSSGGGGGGYRQQYYDQQTSPPQNVGRHPTRIAN